MMPKGSPGAASVSRLGQRGDLEVEIPPGDELETQERPVLERLAGRLDQV